MVIFYRESEGLNNDTIYFTLDETQKLLQSDENFFSLLSFLDALSDVKNILVIRQGEMSKYYGHNIIHAYDSRMLKVATAKSQDEALGRLNKLGVNYILNTFYQDPLITTTPLKKILNNHKVTKLIYSNTNYSLYKIASSDEQINSPRSKLKIQKLSSIINNLSYYTVELYDIQNFDKESNYNFNEYLLEFEITTIKPTMLYINISISNSILSKRNIVIGSGKNVVQERIKTLIPADKLSFKIKSRSQDIATIRKAFLTPLSTYKIRNHMITVPILFDQQLCNVNSQICKINNALGIKIRTTMAKKDIEFTISGTGDICKFRKDQILNFNIGARKLDCYQLSNDKKSKVTIRKGQYFSSITPGANITIHETTIIE